MDLAEVKKRVAAIANERQDDETAHSMEDDLYHDFIYHVSIAGNQKLSALAKEVLKTKKIMFARYHA